MPFPAAAGRLKNLRSITDVSTSPLHAVLSTRGRGRADQGEGYLDVAGGQAQRYAGPPGQRVGAKRIVDQPAASGAEEAAELMAHEGEPLDHRLPSQPEHFDYGTSDLRPDAEPQKSRQRAEDHRRCRRQHEIPAEHQRAADIDAPEQRELIPAAEAEADGKGEWFRRPDAGASANDGGGTARSPGRAKTALRSGRGYSKRFALLPGEDVSELLEN